MLDDKTIYIFVRADLSEEDQLIQASHVIFKITAQAKLEFGDVRMVALDGSGSAKAFNKTRRKLDEKKIYYLEYSDSDHPEWGVTALASLPLTKEQSLPLAEYRLRRYSPRVPLTTESLASMPIGEPKADVAQ